MWFAISMIALFVAYCWYDSFSVPILNGSACSNVANDDTEWRREMTDFLDEMSKTTPEDNQAWHDAGLMTPDHVPPTTNYDWESTS
jgi:hypothetical protein